MRNNKPTVMSIVGPLILAAVLRFLRLPPEEQGAVILDLPEHQKQLFSNALSPWLQKGKG